MKIGRGRIMKLLYFVSIIYISVFLLLLLRCSSEPTAPDTNLELTVSGTVNQLTQTGTFPADSCKITIFISTKSYTVYTDNSGSFSKNVISESDYIRIVVEKEGFQTLDRTFLSSITQNLSLTINFNRILVSGRLFEINHQGTFPFPNCEMKISTGGVDNIVKCDNEGYFKLTTETYDSNVRIVVDRSDYTKIDEIVKIENSIGLEFFLKKTVNYFPLVVGSIWIFDSEKGISSHISGSHTTGIDSCELIEMETDSSWFKIKCVFNGKTILSTNGIPTDTVYYVNTISSITFKNQIGELSVLVLSTDGGFSIFKGSFMDINSNSIVVEIIHPINSSGLIKVIKYDPGDYSLEYDLQLNVGLKYLNFITYPGNPVTHKLSLIDYEIPEL
jgi:hypothetical protein